MDLEVAFINVFICSNRRAIANRMLFSQAEHFCGSYYIRLVLPLEPFLRVLVLKGSVLLGSEIFWVLF